MTRTPAGPDGLAVVEVSGFLPAGRYEVDGSRSSQFASGLLIALAHAVTPEARRARRAHRNRPHRQPTLSGYDASPDGALRDFLHGAEEGVFDLAPACAPAPEGVDVSGDWSQAAVLLCVDAMGGGVMLPCLRRDGLQGDARIVDVLEEMGLRIRQAQGEWHAASPSPAGLTAARIDCPTFPILRPFWR